MGKLSNQLEHCFDSQLGFGDDRQMVAVELTHQITRSHATKQLATSRGKSRVTCPEDVPSGVELRERPSVTYAATSSPRS